MSRHTETLALCPVFRQMDEVKIRQLNMLCYWRRYQAGDVIETRVANEPAISFLVRGSARAYARGPLAKELIIKDFEGGSFFGDFPRLDHCDAGDIEIRALTNTVIAKMPIRSFEDVVQANRGLLEDWMQTISRNNQELIERMAEFSFLSVKERIFAELLRLARRPCECGNRGVISPPPIQAEIAARVNTRREAVSRAIGELERLRLLERRRGAMVIRDLAGVRSLLKRAG